MLDFVLIVTKVIFVYLGVLNSLEHLLLDDRKDLKVNSRSWTFKFLHFFCFGCCKTLSCTKSVRSTLKQWIRLWGRWASLVLLPALGSSHRLGRTACRLWINSIFPPGVSPQKLPACCWTEHPVRFSHTSNCGTFEVKFSHNTAVKKYTLSWKILTEWRHLTFQVSSCSSCLAERCNSVLLWSSRTVSWRDFYQHGGRRGGLGLYFLGELFL